MVWLKKLSNFLSEPRLKGLNPDSGEFLAMHSCLLNEKPMMREVFSEIYDTCIKLDDRYFKNDGQRVEIGAGVSFFKKRHPAIISSDIKKADHLDMVVDALNMPFETGSIRAIYGINCFHHFPDPGKFFTELERVLVKGGGCVLIEPYYGFVASRFYKNAFETEGFDKDQKDWTNYSLGYMMGANQALSYIVFKRDKEKFEKHYNELEIVLQRPLNNYMSYLFSGGLNFRQLLPSFCLPLLKLFGWMFVPFRRILALHHVIVIRKKLG
jgi:SAM-dependent methyltransferase